MDAYTGSAADRRSQRRLRGSRALESALGLVLTGVLVVVAAGCGSSGSEATTSTVLPDTGASLGMLAPPGLYDLKDGRTQALGVLAYRDLEGGFWAVVDALPDEPTVEAAVVAVLVGVEDLGLDLESLQGRFVAADGVLTDGASIRMAGPELEVEDLQEAADMVVSPADDTTE